MRPSAPDDSRPRRKMHPVDLSGKILHAMNNRTVIENYGRLSDHDRSFDIQFWQSQTPSERMAAMWELIVHAYAVKGIDVRQHRLQRTSETFQRQPGSLSGRQRIRSRSA